MDFDLDGTLNTFFSDGVDAALDTSFAGFVATSPLESSMYDVTEVAPYDLNSEIGLKDVGYTPPTLSNGDISQMMKGQPTGLLSTAKSMLEENPKLAEFLLKSAGGAWAASKAEDAAKLTEEMALRKRQRISDSIMGMAEMPSGDASPLTRLNGQRVYKDKEPI
jgi:hypothetical protein